jgi:hypothetical protein
VSEDPALAQAFEVMAGVVTFWLVDNAVASGEASEMWENWPGIGEQDWARVIELVAERSPSPSAAEIEWAEKTLAARAER